MNFQMFKLVLEKAEETRDQIANIRWIMEKAREFQKNIHLCFIDYAKAFDCVSHNKLWKILQEMGIPDHLTCLLRNHDGPGVVYPHLCWASQVELVVKNQPAMKETWV